MPDKERISPGPTGCSASSGSREVALDRSRSYSMGLVSARSLPKTLPDEPVLFIPSSRACPSSVQEMIAMIGASGDLIRVGRADAPTPRRPSP